MSVPGGLWFNPNQLTALTDPGTAARGRDLYVAQKVLDLSITPEDVCWRLEGEVQGSQRRPYSVSIELSLASDGSIENWDSDCTCPVGYNCKHGVALTMKAAYQGLRILGSSAYTAVPSATRTPPTPESLEATRLAAQARMDEVERLQAEAQLLQWFYDMDRAAGADAHRAKPTHATSKAPEQYLYLLKVTGAPHQSSQLMMEAVTSTPRVGGGWTKPKAVRTPPREGLAAYDHASNADREVLQLLMAMPGKGYGYYSAYSGSPSAMPQGQAGLLALQMAASTGRLYSCAENGAPETVIQWGPTQTLDWTWNEVTATHGGTPGWALRAKLHADPSPDDAGHGSGSAKLLLNSPPLYLDTARGLCGPVQVHGISDAQLAVMLKAPPLKPSALEKHQQDLMQRLGPLPAPPMLQQLFKLDGITPTACLHLSINPPEMARYRGMVRALLRFDYQGIKGWWAGQGASVIVEGPQGRTLLHRDSEAELDAITRLMDLGLASGENGEFGIPGDEPQHDWMHWADNDYSEFKEAGFTVTLDDALQDWITHADTLEVNMQAQGGHGADPHADPADLEATSPWFNLSLGMEINGQRHNILPFLPQLIAAAANSPPDPETGQPSIPPFVFLSNPTGTGFIRLPTDTLKPWMAALLELVGDRGHDFSGDTLKLSRLDALRTSAALGEGVAWEGAQALRALVQQLSGRAAIAEAPVPASVQASLRPYQQQGVNWLQFLRTHGLGGILADDMGLGKTLQTLVHIQIEKDAGRLTLPALIIAPVSLMGNWRQEAARFCPSLRTLVLHGKDRHDVAGDMGSHDLVIAPYSLLQRDKERWLEQAWHLVVLDEAQNIKNANTHAAQVVGQLQARHRLCLSGTPMENHLGEIWSLFHFVMPGFLGSQARFKELFRTPIEREADSERLAQLRARVTPFMLRRTKALVAHELPPKVETVMRVELTGKQADLYETIRLGMEKSVREALNTKGLAKSQITILDALLKLRQVCCDPGLVKLDAAKKVKTSAKLEQLMELLPEMVAEGRKILLFSQFTTMLTLIEAELKKRNIAWVKLTGQSQKREDIIARFTSGEVPIFLISLKAGGVGLNLPQADTVIHYDPWWNPAVEAQATDRAHRIGQTQSVWVVKLVAQGTIEERILALQERKAALADSMYSGSAARKEPLFNEDDLAELLKPLG
ncbi:MAG: DEAD/DEAH box helicase [Burkholderiales bacterium]|nr:DEAD/DEAH box helicase [Burkholderiales bacterium]